MKVADYKCWTVISVELAASVCILMSSVFVRGELSEQGAFEQKSSGDIDRRTLQSRRLQSSVNKTIYGGPGGYDPSWSGRTNNADVSYYKPAANQPEQMCMTFQATGAWMAFNCPNCTTPPFALNTTAGLAYSITSYQVNGTDADVGVIMPFPFIVHVMLMDSNFNVLCPADLLHSMAAQGPMQSAKTLFQNYPSNNGRPDCRQAYNTAEYIGFQSWQGNVSMCLDNLKLLPSAVVPQETAAAVPATPPLMNCWDRDVQPVDQNGNYTAQPLPDLLLSNITRSTTANSFTVFPRVDVPYGRYFRAINDSCSVIVAPNVTTVGQCSQTAAWGYGIFGKDGHGDACCFDTTNYTDGSDGNELPQVLATICDNLLLGGRRCDGIQYNQADHIAYFLRADPANGIAYPYWGNPNELCNCPNGAQWVRNTALPSWHAEAGLLNTSSIYSGGLQHGWNLNTTSTNMTIQQTPQLGPASSQLALANPQLGPAICFTAPTTQDNVRFTCQDCPSASLSPYSLSQTSGFEMWISAASSFDSHGPDSGFDANATLPAVQLELADRWGGSLCSMTLTPTGTDQQNKLVHARALYQNAVECIPALPGVKSLQFSVSEGNEGGSFCIDNLGFLPSTLQTEDPANLPPVPEYPNCHPPAGDPSPAWYVEPQPINQNGNFTISGGDPAMSSNAQGSGAEFQVMQNVDMFGFDLQLQPDSSGCSSISTPSTHNVTECASITRIVRNSSSCCFDTKASDIMHQDGVGNASLPNVLAEICGTLILGDRVCQGWVYDYATGIASFLGGTKNAQMDFGKFPPCNRPNVTTWVLKAAISNTPDTRSFSEDQSGSGGPDIGAVIGVIVSVLGGIGSACGLAAWLFVTNGYRLSKQRIRMTVASHVTVEDVADGSAKDALQDGMQSATLKIPLPLTGSPDVTQEMRRVAAEITRQCLRRWDGVLSIRAGNDISGSKMGIWRSKFDGVRCSVLLLAFRRVNKAFQSKPSAPVTLMAAWQQSATKKERQQIVERIAKVLRHLSDSEAQDLQSDPETIDDASRRCCWCC